MVLLFFAIHEFVSLDGIKSVLVSFVDEYDSSGGEYNTSNNEIG